MGWICSLAVLAGHLKLVDDSLDVFQYRAMFTEVKIVLNGRCNFVTDKNHSDVGSRLVRLI